MFVTETTKAARKLAGKGATIFNDKLADGSRSLKVWRWGLNEYELCRVELESQGHTVKLVSFPVNRWGTTKMQHRLHVTEN